MKPCKKFIVFFVAVLSLQTASAQHSDESTDTGSPAFSYNVNYLAGFAVKHDQFMGHLSKGITRGGSVEISKRTFGDNDWQILTNYPDVGLSISFYDYGSEVMGESIGFNYYTDYYLFRWKGLSSTYRVGVGLGYHTNPFDRETNNKNIALPWIFTFNLQSALNLHYDIADRWRVKAGVNLSHFSFADIRRPNKGVNILTANLGMSYYTGSLNKEYNTELSESFDKNVLYYNVLLHGSVVTFKPADDNIYPVYGLSFYIQKPISRLFDVHLGVDGFNNQVVKEFIKRDETLQSDEFPDHKRAGVHGGLEFHMDRMSLILSFGRYIYKPYRLHSNYYQKYGLKYYLNDNWFAYAGFKSHGSNAENSEFGLGYRF